MAQANSFGSYSPMAKVGCPDCADNVELIDHPEPGDTADGPGGDVAPAHNSNGPTGQPAAQEMGY